MVETENKENVMVKGILSTLTSAAETLKTEIANIDEVFKKKLEEAKASLVACLAETEKQIEYWNGVNGIETTAVPKKRRSRKTAVETILGQQNEEKTEETVDETEVVVDKEAVTEEPATENVTDEGPEFDGAGFTGADNDLPFGNPAAETVEPSTEAVESAEEQTEETPEEEIQSVEKADDWENNWPKDW